MRQPMALPSAYLAFHWGRVVKKEGLRKLCQFAGLVGLGAGWMTCLLPVLVLGSLAAAVSLGNFGLQAVRLHTGYAWVALALLGIAVIFCASLVGKGGTRQIMKITLWGRLKAGSR